jgi:pilus assembly protein CpaC
MKLNFGLVRVAPQLVLAGLAYVSLTAQFALAEPAIPAKAGSNTSRAKQPPVANAKSGLSAAPAQRLVAADEATKPGGPAQPLTTQLPDAQTTMGPTISALLGKATLIRQREPIERISVGNPAIADVTLISLREVYLLGKDIGTTNLIVWTKDGAATIMDVKVGADPLLLQAELRTMLPGEPDINVKTSADSLALTGTVSDAVKAEQAVQIAQAWIRRLTRGLVAPVTLGDGKSGTTVSITETQNARQTADVAGPRIINMLQVRAPQQVMLEVKVAEISKTLLDKLGATIRMQGSIDGTTFSFLQTSEFLNQLLGSASIVTDLTKFVQVDAQRDDGLIKLLAEPNLMAISGQEASFNAGGKIFIPVASANNLGNTIITLEEKEFGVGVKFTPTVLDGGRINLKVASRVSEPQQTGTPFTATNGSTSILPSFLERRAETTVQLHDGQSFMIAGLIRNNSAESIKRFPGLGEIPILGTLFRSAQFQKDKTELMFVITPRLVKPLPPNYTLPTDNFVEPTRKEYFLEGKTEGTRPATQGQPTPAKGAQGTQSGGFEMK